jgi:hypothetical protein
VPDGIRVLSGRSTSDHSKLQDWDKKMVLVMSCMTILGHSTQDNCLILYQYKSYPAFATYISLFRARYVLNMLIRRGRATLVPRSCRKCNAKLVSNYVLSRVGIGGMAVGTQLQVQPEIRCVQGEMEAVKGTLGLKET